MKWAWWATLVPLVRRIVAGARLWLVDRAFCDLTQPARSGKQGDHYLVRYHPKIKFYRDPNAARERAAMPTAERIRSNGAGWVVPRILGDRKSA